MGISIYPVTPNFAAEFGDVDLSANLSFQVEHHVFPDMPSSRYQQIAPRVREICERYGLPYTTGPLWKQVGSTWGKIFRLALPDRKPRAAALVG